LLAPEHHADALAASGTRLQLFRRMTGEGPRQLPVVEGPLPARPVGLLRRSDILAAYERTLAQRPSRLSSSGPSLRE
jgi:hypothetical protein